MSSTVQERFLALNLFDAYVNELRVRKSQDGIDNVVELIVTVPSNEGAGGSVVQQFTFVQPLVVKAEWSEGELNSVHQEVAGYRCLPYDEPSSEHEDTGLVETGPSGSQWVFEFGGEFNSAYARVMTKGRVFVNGARGPLRAINKDLYQSERDLLDDEGLPGREWFKSTMYATGIYTGFEGDPMPGVQQMVNAKNVTAAQAQVRKVAAAIDRMAARAERVTTSMSVLAR